MIEKLFDSTILGNYKTNSIDVEFTTFKTLGQNVFGNSGSRAPVQHLTNAGSSMLTNTANTVPNIMSLINSHCNITSLGSRMVQHSLNFSEKYSTEDDIYHGYQLEQMIKSKTPETDLPGLDPQELGVLQRQQTTVEELLKFEKIEITNKQIYKEIRNTYLKYKSDLNYRINVNEKIFVDIEKLELGKNIPILFVYILYAINVLKSNHFLKDSKKAEYTEAKKVFADEADFIKKIGNILSTADNLIDITDCCTGQYRFVDYQLSCTNNEKLLPQALVYLCVDNSGLVARMMKYKAETLRSK